MAADYHELTRHSLASVQANRHGLDWPNQPLPFKIYTSLDGLPLPSSFEASPGGALEALAGSVPPDSGVVLDSSLLARLLYYSNGVTKLLRGMPFRAAACTGALYHIELYVACQDLPDLQAGVYHYSAHDHALRLLRSGDYRGALVAACADEPRVADAQAVVLFTSTFWRNSWKYQARAYRHSFWDSGTVLANLLAVAAAQRLTASLVLGFADPLVNRMLGVDGEHEAAICLVALGSAVSRPPPAPALEPLDLPTRTLSPHGEIEYPAITAAHAATSLADAAAVTAWRPTPAGTAAVPPPAAYGRSLPETPSIEEVITRRGSSRRFVREPITLSAMQSIVDVATQPVASDVAALGRLTTPYLIINAVDDLAAGAYVYREHDLQPLEHGDFRRVAGYLDLGQELAADAAVNVYSLCSLRDLLTRVGDRAYRAAQLEGAVEGGRLYLAAYALDLGATGLTFFDDDVTRFFDVPDQAVMFLTALGKPRRTRGSAAR